MRALRLAAIELGRFRGLAALLPVLLVLLPVVLGVGVLWAVWDPYGKVNQIPVAVVNSDRPVQLGPHRINGGERFVAQLPATRTFAWHVTDAKQAERGLADGRYALRVEVPANFSATLARATQARPQRAALHITKDDAHGYLTGVMVETKRAELQKQINSAAHAAWSSALFAELDSIQDALRSAYEASQQLADRTKLNRQSASALTSGMSQLNGPNTGATQHLRQIQAATAQLEQQLSAVDSDLPGGLSAQLSSLRAPVQQLQMATAQLQNGDDPRATGLDVLLTNSGVLNTGAQQLDTRAQQLLGLVGQNLRRLPTGTAEQVNSTVDVLASPAELRTVTLHPAYTAGGGFAPLALAACAGLVGVASYLVFRPANPRAIASETNPGTLAFAGWLPVALLGILSSLGLVTALHFVLGVPTVHWGWALGIAALAGAAAVAWDFFLRSWLGWIGSALSCVVLLGQALASGAVYPVPTLPAALQAIHPWLPMTYLVHGLRSALTGGEPLRLYQALIAMGIMLVVGLVLAGISLRRLRTKLV